MVGSSVSHDRVAVVAPAVVGFLAGLAGGALLISWVGPLWLKVVGAAVILAVVAVPPRARFAAAAAFLVTLGAVGLATLALFTERPDLATALVAGTSVMIGVGCAIIAVSRQRKSGAGKSSGP